MEYPRAIPSRLKGTRFLQHVLPTGFMKIGGGVSLACALRDGFKGRLVLYEPGHAALHAHVGRHARARRLRRELQSGSKDVKIVEKTRDLIVP